MEDVGIDESIVLKHTLKKWDKREWTDLNYVTQDRDKWWLIVSMVIYLQIL